MERKEGTPFEGFVAGLLRSRWRGLVGVDWSGDRVLVERADASRGPGFVRDASHRLPPAPDGPARADATARELRALVAAEGLRGRPAASWLEGSEVLVRRITLPPMKRADLLSAMALECRKHVAGPIEDTVIRYEVIGETPAAGDPPQPRGLDLLVAAAPRRLVEECRTVLARGGLTPAILTVPPVALRACLGRDGATAANEVVAYFDMGTRSSRLMVLRGTEIRFTREFSIGTAALSESLRSIVVPGQGTITLSAAESDALLREHGVPLGDDESRPAGGIPLAAVSIMLRPVLERLVREVWNSFDYVNEQFLGDAVSRLVTRGDAARIRNLSEYLSGVLKIPVDRADPSEGSGLCDLAPGALNFLEPAAAGLSYRLAEAVPQRVALAAAAVLLLSVSLPSEVTLLREQRRIESLREEFSSLSVRADGVRRFQEARAAEARSAALMARLQGASPRWSEGLRDLSYRVGPEVSFTTFEVLEKQPGLAPEPGDPSASGKREVRITGLIRIDGRGPEPVLGRLMESLAGSALLRDVRILSCEVVAPGRGSFALLAALAE
jgi:type IV pilus assembly protein PilM